MPISKSQQVLAFGHRHTEISSASLFGKKQKVGNEGIE